MVIYKKESWAEQNRIVDTVLNRGSLKTTKDEKQILAQTERNMRGNENMKREIMQQQQMMQQEMEQMCMEEDMMQELSCQSNSIQYKSIQAPVQYKATIGAEYHKPPKPA